MAEVEREARLRGCRLVMGLTYDVLIGDFYDRLGYRTIGLLEDCPAGTDNTLVLQGPLAGHSSPVRHESSSARECDAVH